MSLYDRHGHRKYLTIAERQAFLEAAKRGATPEELTFCSALAHTGGRISELLALAPDRIELNPAVVVLRSLKKRRDGVYRAVPVPEALARQLDAVHHVSGLRADTAAASDRLWPWCRTSAWGLVTTLMHKAGICGPQATPKGLRHGFAVAALQSGVPLNVVSKWLGHSRLSTTAIYADAVGDEERSLAERFWSTF